MNKSRFIALRMISSFLRAMIRVFGKFRLPLIRSLTSVASLASRHGQNSVHAAFFWYQEGFDLLNLLVIQFACVGYTSFSSLSAQSNVGASLKIGGVTASTGLLAAERHAGVWTPVIAHKIISADNNLALAA